MKRVDIRQRYGFNSSIFQLTGRWELKSNSLVLDNFFLHFDEYSLLLNVVELLFFM